MNTRFQSKYLAAQQRRRSILGETREPRIALSQDASEHGMPSRLLLGCHKPASALRFSKRRESVVSASEFRELQFQVKELQQLLRKKLLENEILKEAMSAARKRSGASTRRHNKR